jgi:hypothetical protein
MTIRNVHERLLPATPAAIGALLDQLASPADPLWPHHRWPPMRLDRGLQVGATGGHGPIRYVVDRYQPGRTIAFRFTAPQGLHGEHRFEVLANVDGSRLRHVLEGHTTGPMRLLWPLLYRPLHDALIQDSLDRAEHAVTGRTQQPPRQWSLRVRALRWIIAVGLLRRHSRSQPPSRSSTRKGSTEPDRSSSTRGLDQG